MLLVIKMKTVPLNIQLLVYVAGLSQVALALGSLAIPGILKWRAELAKVQHLIKQMFWVYAAYIFVINVCFGLISIFAADDLTNGSNLAVAITGFIALYWVSRVLIQFFYFDRTHFPKGVFHKACEITLVVLFIFLSVVYGRAFYVNFMHIHP